MESFVQNVTTIQQSTHHLLLSAHVSRIQYPEY